MWREKGEEEQTIKMSDSRPRRDFQVAAIVISRRNYCPVDWFEGGSSGRRDYVRQISYDKFSPQTEVT